MLLFVSGATATVREFAQVGELIVPAAGHKPQLIRLIPRGAVACLTDPPPAVPRLWPAYPPLSTVFDVPPAQSRAANSIQMGEEVRPHAELVVLCATTADRLERSGICADILGTVLLLREAGDRLARLSADLVAAEALVLELRASPVSTKPPPAPKKPRRVT